MYLLNVCEHGSPQFPCVSLSRIESRTPIAIFIRNSQLSSNLYFHQFWPLQLWNPMFRSQGQINPIPFEFICKMSYLTPPRSKKTILFRIAGGVETSMTITICTLAFTLPSNFNRNLSSWFQLLPYIFSLVFHFYRFSLSLPSTFTTTL